MKCSRISATKKTEIEEGDVREAPLEEVWMFPECKTSTFSKLGEDSRPERALVQMQKTKDWEHRAKKKILTPKVGW